METIAVNMFNIIDRFSRLIFHCYAANIVNVIDIVLFLPLIYLEIAKLTFAAAEVVEKAREAFSNDDGEVLLEDLCADIPTAGEPRAAFALLA